MSVRSLPTSPIRLHSNHEAEIATLAYRYYCEEGCPEGKEEEHWLRAEREISGRSQPGESESPEAESAPARSENPPFEQ